MTLSITIETDTLLFGKLMGTGLNDFVLRQILVMASIADLTAVSSCVFRSAERMERRIPIPKRL